MVLRFRGLFIGFLFTDFLFVEFSVYRGRLGVKRVCGFFLFVDVSVSGGP